MASIKLDFTGIGGPRCGSTKISKCLAEHPEICFSQRKELHYFNFDHIYQQGEKFLRRHFSHCQPGQIKGEWSTDYLYSKKAATRIRAHNPDVKILVCLRHPVERAYSHYLLQKYSASIMPFQSFLRAVSGDDKYNYLKLGFYSKHLPTYLSLFPKENICLVIYEEFFKDLAGSIKKLYGFLGVNPNFVPPSLHENVDYRGKKKFYSLALTSIINKLILFYKRSRFKKLWRIFYLRQIFRWLKKKNRRQGAEKFTKPAMDEKTRAMLKTLYRDEITAIEHIIGRSLDTWKIKT